MPETFSETVRIITDSHVGKLLDSDEYNKVLEKAFENTGLDLAEARKAATDYIIGTSMTGPWAEASARFAGETRGINNG